MNETALLLRVLKFFVDDQLQGHDDIRERRANFMMEILKDFLLQFFHVMAGNFPHLVASARLFRSDASQDCLHPGKQLFGDERLGNVIVRTIPDAVHPIIHACTGSQEDKWDGCQQGILPHQSA